MPGQCEIALSGKNYLLLLFFIVQQLKSMRDFTCPPKIKTSLAETGTANLYCLGVNHKVILLFTSKDSTSISFVVVVFFRSVKRQDNVYVKGWGSSHLHLRACMYVSIYTFDTAPNKNISAVTPLVLLLQEVTCLSHWHCLIKRRSTLPLHQRIFPNHLAQ